MPRYIDADEFVKRVIQYPRQSTKTIGLALADTPTADVVERKEGKWERHYSRPNVFADLYWHCSVCGFKNDNNYADKYHKYCPNCGAKMDGKETANEKD